VATTVGGAVAIGAHLIAGGADHDYTIMALVSAVPYLLAGLWARGFERKALGPDQVERDRRETVAEVARGLVAGARHLQARRPALLALTAIGVHRICYGVWTVCALLLYRNYFHSHGIFHAGLAGLGVLVVGVAVGGGVASLITPAASRRIGLVPWSAALLVVAGIVEVACGLPYQLPLMIVSGTLLGFASQGIKICVDTTVQREIEDDFRGRIFTLYDTLFNLALVVAAVLTALVLPDNGHSPGSVITVGVVYVIAAAAYLRAARTQPAPV
jgi:MFS family permease